MFSYKRTKLLSIIERKIRRRAKNAGGRGGSLCDAARRLSCPSTSLEIASKRKTWITIWRLARSCPGQNGDEWKARGGKPRRSISATRARARTPADSHVDRIPRVHASRLDKSTLKSQTGANSRGKFAYHFHQTTTTAIRISRRRNVSYLSKTFAISWNRPPRHITRISRAIFPKRVPYMRETENRARLSNTEPTHLIRKI